MLRTTLLVAVVTSITALTLTISPSASTPRERAQTHMGKTAYQWHRIAVQRRVALDRARIRLGEKIREARGEARSLRRWVKHRQPYSVSYVIKLAAVTFGVSEYELNRVASCESGHNPAASNGQYRGVFQEGPMFERGRYGQAGFSVWDAFANVFTAAETVSHQGWSQWSCKP